MAEEHTRLWGLAGFAVLTAAGVAVALHQLDTLSPRATPLMAVPPLLIGLYIAVSATWIRDLGLYGALTRPLPAGVHPFGQLLGCALTGIGVWWLLALPPAGAGEVVRTLPRLEAWCVGPPDVRLDREVLPTLDALVALRASQSEPLQAEVDAGIHTLLERCAEQTRVAFADPRGTHSSWRRLRDWMGAHPELSPVSAGAPLFEMPFRQRARQPAPLENPVPVILEP